VTGKPLRVAVVSRHELTRAGLVGLLADHPGRAVVIAVSSQDGHLGGHDVAVYDLAGLIDTTGNDLKHLVATGTPVVALVPHARPELGEGALAAGVAEVVPMSISADGLLETLEKAAAGGSPSPKQRVEQHRQAICAQCDLTAREAEILTRIGTGRTNQEIADELYLSINSIKTYVRTAYKKVGVKSRSQAVLWVCQHDSGWATDSSTST